MDILIYLTLSFLCLAAAVTLTLLQRFRREQLSPLQLTTITLLALASVLIIRMPVFWQTGEGVLTAFIHSLINAVNTIAMGGDLNGAIKNGAEYITGSNLAQGLKSTSDLLPHLYAFYIVLQALATPVLCGYALFKTLSLALSRVVLMLCHDPVFLFSRLSEESLLLARSILHSVRQSEERGLKPRKLLLCFIHTGAELSPTAESMWQELRHQGAIRIRESLSHKLFPRSAPSVNCILCDPNEQHNLHELIGLLEGPQSIETRRFTRKATVRYFVYAQSRQAEQVIDSLAGTHIKSDADCRNKIICMLNPKENLAVDILDTTPLYRYVARDEHGERRLNILIAGSTLLADRFLRNAYACGQMHDCKLSVTVAATDAKAFRERLFTSAPMLQQADSPVISMNGPIRFVTIADPLNITDEELLREADYIMVAFASDEENVRCARRIRTVIERQKLTDPRRAAQPVAIVYAVEDAALHLLCQRIDTAAAGGNYVPCTMMPAGSRERQNDSDVLFGHALLRRAFFLDKAYDPNDTLAAPDLDQEGVVRLQDEFIHFMNSAYNRRSSVATALHLAYREATYRELPDDPGKTAKLLAEAEHRRWCAYMIMSGFIPPTLQQLEAYFYRGKASHKNEALKLHPCIVPDVIEPTGALWDMTKPVTGPLDQVSRTLHTLTARRLHEILSRHGLPCPAPDALKQEDVQDEVARIPDPEDKERARKLYDALFKNYKRIDIDIVSKTDRILQLASDPEILDALRLFWLEGGK